MKIPMFCELLLNPIENPALFVTAGGSKNGSLTITFFIVVYSATRYLVNTEEVISR